MQCVVPQVYPWPWLVLLLALPRLAARLLWLLCACCTTNEGGNGNALLSLGQVFPSRRGTENKRATDMWEDGRGIRDSPEGGRWAWQIHCLYSPAPAKAWTAHLPAPCPVVPAWPYAARSLSTWACAALPEGEGRE